MLRREGVLEYRPCGPYLVHLGPLFGPLLPSPLIYFHVDIIRYRDTYWRGFSDDSTTDYVRGVGVDTTDGK